MKIRIILLVLIISSLFLVGCVKPEEYTEPNSYFLSKMVKESNLTRIIDPEFGVVCYWFQASGVSSTLSCVKALEE